MPLKQFIHNLRLLHATAVEKSLVQPKQGFCVVFWLNKEFFRMKSETSTLHMILAYEQGDQDIMKTEARMVFTLAIVLGYAAEVICR